jgi:putative ABC transport system substrate-binding protein
VVPTALASGFLVNPTNPFADLDIKDAQTATSSLGHEIVIAKAATENEIDIAIGALAQQGVGSLVVAGDILLYNRREQITALAARSAMPTLYPWSEATVGGGLMSYGADIRDAFRIGGAFAGKILRGEKPAELPVEQATKIELVLNMKTAKTLGVTFPLSLLGRADEVIE